MGECNSCEELDREWSELYDNVRDMFKRKMRKSLELEEKLAEQAEEMALLNEKYLHWRGVAFKALPNSTYQINLDREPKKKGGG